jgi:hypothetical protein
VPEAQDAAGGMLLLGIVHIACFRADTAYVNSSPEYVTLCEPAQWRRT